MMSLVVDASEPVDLDPTIDPTRIPDMALFDPNAGMGGGDAGSLADGGMCLPLDGPGCSPTAGLGPTCCPGLVCYAKSCSPADGGGWWCPASCLKKSGAACMDSIECSTWCVAGVCA